LEKTAPSITKALQMVKEIAEGESDLSDNNGKRETLRAVLHLIVRADPTSAL
jgi:hypothetical protein